MLNIISQKSSTHHLAKLLETSHDVILAAVQNVADELNAEVVDDVLFLDAGDLGVIREQVAIEVQRLRDAKKTKPQP